MARLLLLLSDSLAAPGGIAQYNRDLLSALHACEPQPIMQILAYAPHARQRSSGDEQASMASVEMSTAPGYRQVASRAAALWVGLRMLRRFKPDIVFCGHLHLAPLAALLAWWAGARLWLQCHGIECWERPGNLRRFAANRAHLISAVSRYTRRRLNVWLAYQPERVRVLPNTVDAIFTPEVDAAPLRKQLGLDRHPGPLLLTVGRLASGERYKGHDRVIALLPQLCKAHPQLLYLIAGEGDDQARLQSLAEQTGVAAAVRFLGRVPRADLPALYALSDLFVMPSSGEGFGIAFLEAMASGTAAVGLAGDGSADPLLDGALGHCVAENELAATILAALASPPQRAALSARTQAAFGREVFQQQCQQLWRVARQAAP